MGMFDNIEVKIPLPGNMIPLGEDFQTKSFNCLMEKYVITESGEIYKDHWDYDWDEEYGDYGGLRRVEGSNERRYLTNLNETINFYGSRPIGHVWRDYFATFVNGKLTRVWFEDAQY